ncbi:Predicted Fe-Mo cluster-binding protein, NifX family [Mariniphaga anaerophila]|uniref:Predicted Fe-Mo cluster-binding protein, NifX family n=1 Tax=Mariniphaga anaerophila TaxID=1484053 RepID=A0A1M4Y6X0_9BACT|nr:NifB/NifX family molybdenum-iron cluster-binding protein [Mariniphaga anaerophila]SHF01366.1 Predicted Fe-Mo cluster-binding protein, NifX family [Mariniphaga anaerophila]
MKVAITSVGNSLKSKLDLRFGRSVWLCIYDTETKQAEFRQNENKDANGGAGTKTAEKVAELGAEQVVSGDFGPKAKALLEKLKIQMVIFDEPNQTVGGIIEKMGSTKKQQTT